MEVKSFMRNINNLGDLTFPLFDSQEHHQSAEQEHCSYHTRSNQVDLLLQKRNKHIAWPTSVYFLFPPPTEVAQASLFGSS